MKRYWRVTSFIVTSAASLWLANRQRSPTALIRTLRATLIFVVVMLQMNWIELEFFLGNVIDILKLLLYK